MSRVFSLMLCLCASIVRTNCENQENQPLRKPKRAGASLIIRESGNFTSLNESWEVKNGGESC